MTLIRFFAALVVLAAAVGFGPGLAMAQEEPANATTGNESSLEELRDRLEDVDDESARERLRDLLQDVGDGDGEESEPGAVDGGADVDEPPEPAGDLDESAAPVATFSNGAVITNYEFRDGYVYVHVEAERRTSVTIADSLAGIGEDGATKVPQETTAVRPGGGTVTHPATSFQGGQSVGVAIGGETVRLSTEMDGAEGDNPLEYFGGTSGVFGGITLSVVTSLGAAGVIRWRENKGVVRGTP